MDGTDWTKDLVWTGLRNGVLVKFVPVEPDPEETLRVRFRFLDDPYNNGG